MHIVIIIIDKVAEDKVAANKVTKDKVATDKVNVITAEKVQTQQGRIIIR